MPLVNPPLRREAEQPVKPFGIHELINSRLRESCVPGDRRNRRQCLGEIMLPHVAAGVVERLAHEPPACGDQPRVGSDKLVTGLSQSPEEVVEQE